MRSADHRTGLALLAVFTLSSSSAALAHGDEDHGQSPAKPAITTPGDAAAPRRLADGSLFVPKPLQRQLGLRTQPAEVKELAASVELNGKVISDPNTGGRVQARQAGSIVPGARGLPVLGQKVRRGETLAWLQPIVNSIERGNQQALLAGLEAELAIAGRKVKRLEQLDGAVPQKEIETARLEWEALAKRRAAVGAGLNAREALVAPVSGVISAAYLVAGQVVEAREILFEIIDPARLAVEALAYEPGLVNGIVSASASLPGMALELEFIGGGRQLREQALPLLFRIVSPKAPLAVGQPLKVIARTAGSSQGISLPLSALARNGAGETVVWIHSEAERFAPRKVRVQPLDAGRVAVTGGLAAGDRVVVEGAGLLAQVR